MLYDLQLSVECEKQNNKENKITIGLPKMVSPI